MRNWCANAAHQKPSAGVNSLNYMNEERSPAKPAADTKTPIVKNPATPGIQTTNKPDGRDEPSTGETR